MLIANNKAMKEALLKDKYTLALELSNSTLTDEPIETSKIKQNSFSVNRFSVTGSTIEIGSATAAEMQVSLDNADGSFDDWTFEGASIYAALAVSSFEKTQDTSVVAGKEYYEYPRASSLVNLDNISQVQLQETNPNRKGWYELLQGSMPIGYFVVDEVVHSRNDIHLVCLDKMVRLDKTAGTITYTTPSALISKICTDCGLTYSSGDSSLVNSSVTLATPTSGNITYRQLLMWVCQITGTCAYINEANNLVLQWYHKKTYTGSDAEERAAQDTITPDKRFSSTIDREAITLSGVSVTVGDTAYATKDSDDYILSIEGNELISADNYSTILSGLVGRLSTTSNNVRTWFSYTPFTASTLNMCWLQPLDMTVFVDNNENEHDVIITDWTFSRGNSLQLSGKGESQTRKGYASNPPFTAAQTRIIEQIKNAVPDVQIDDKIAAVFALNEAVNNGVMLNETTVNGQKYYHDGGTLADSNYIAVYNSGGFAWTKGDDCWNDGNPTFDYGLDTNSAQAILNAITATKINADLINAGQVSAGRVDAANLIAQNLKIKNGNTVVHKFSNGTGHNAVIGGANGITYDDTNGVHIGSNVNIDGTVTIGGSATIGETIASEVADAVEDLDFKGIDDQVVEYAISTSGSNIPSDSASAGRTTALYAVLDQQSNNYLSTINTDSTFNAAYQNVEIMNAAEFVSTVYINTQGQNYDTIYLYSFTRTDTNSGNFTLGNWTYLGSMDFSGTVGSTIFSQTLYYIDVSGGTISTGDIEDAISDWSIQDNMIPSASQNAKCYSFTATITENGGVNISNIALVWPVSD